MYASITVALQTLSDFDHTGYQPLGRGFFVDKRVHTGNKPYQKVRIVLKT